MTMKNKLVCAAFAGLFTAGVMTANSAFAGHHDKNACKTASGCKGKTTTEKANCKTADGKEKHSCKTESKTDKHACTTKSGCKSKSE